MFLHRRIAKTIVQLSHLQFAKIAGYSFTFIGQTVYSQTITFQYPKKLVGKTFHLFQCFRFDCLQRTAIVFDTVLVLQLPAQSVTFFYISFIKDIPSEVLDFS